MFYTFYQNNSGGIMYSDDNVAEYVVIEADNAEKANAIAGKVGIYFNGVSKGIDCPCCGNRWLVVFDADGYGDGSEFPQVGGVDVFQTFKPTFSGERCIVYFSDGRKVILP